VARLGFEPCTELVIMLPFFVTIPEKAAPRQDRGTGQTRPAVASRVNLKPSLTSTLNQLLDQAQDDVRHRVGLSQSGRCGLLEDLVTGHRSGFLRVVGIFDA